VPGSVQDGSIDPVLLKAWTDRARASLAAGGRAAIGDQLICKLLSHAAQGRDGIWPHEAVRDIIEEICSRELERGLEIGVYNNRGMVSKSLMEGGEQERRLADQYGASVSALADRWSRTAAMLRRIEARYRAEAGSEDISAELRKDRVWD
jgi:hypothetical protein